MGLFITVGKSGCEQPGRTEMVVRMLKLEDYAVWVVVLVVSMAIGVYFAWAGRGRGSAQEFLTGGRKLSIFPVSMSMIASLMSSITVLSNPAEVRFMSKPTKSD